MDILVDHKECFVVMLHGFNTEGTLLNVKRIRPFYIGKSVLPMLFEYGKFGIGDTYLKNDGVSSQLADLIKSKKEEGYYTIVLAHSNGCAITMGSASEYNAPIDKAVFIGPALDRDADIPDNIKSVDVWYSPHDFTVRLSAILPFHPWGDMGSIGYKGKSDKVSSINLEEICNARLGHHTVFNREEIEKVGELIVIRSMVAPDGYVQPKKTQPKPITISPIKRPISYTAKS